MQRFAALSLSLSPACITVVYEPPAPVPTTSAAASSESSSTASTDTTGAADSSSTGGASDICKRYGALAGECVGDASYGEYVETYCDESIAAAYETSDGCGAARSEYFACLSSLPCEELFLLDACADAMAAADAACPA
jgi:hypothetical protein